MAVVTVSRIHGVGGREFGRALADELGYDYVDKELLGAVASRAEASEDTISFYEGTAPGPAQLFRDFCHRKYPGTRPEIMDPACYADVLRAVITDLARRDRVVIVGRGGQSIVADHPRAVHLRLIAGREHLVGRLVGRPEFDGLAKEEVWRRIQRRREAQRLFVMQHFGCDVEDPLLYHLVMNFGRLAMSDAVQVATALVRLRESAPAGP